MMNLSTGISWDAGESTGGAGSPYIGAGGVIIPEGKRAIRLVNMMPLGFKFSTSGVRTVNTQYIESLEFLQGGLPGNLDDQPDLVLEHPGDYREDRRINRESPGKKGDPR
jgi:hypothetical protein